MWTQDFVRVVQGAGKVVDHVMRSQRSDLSRRSAQLSKHSTELARLVPSFLHAHGSPQATTDASMPVRTIEQPMAKTKARVLETQVREDHPIETTSNIPESQPVQRTTELPPTTTRWTTPNVELETHQAGEEAQDALETIEHAHERDEQDRPRKVWAEKHVPSSPLSRILGFGSLAARLAVGTAAEFVRTGGQHSAYNALVSDANVEKLAETLCTMRGAALKLGQMLSIQDESVIPAKLAVALERVRENAHIMPKPQLHDQLETELGPDWRSKFQDFDDVPIAAASIGQVHRATLLNGARVAIKIQYPGVAESIDSDVRTLKRLVTYTNLLPRGLYMDELLRVAQAELRTECDYVHEATQQERFRTLVEHSSDLAATFVVPRVYRALSTPRVLTTQRLSGVAMDQAVHLSQSTRNRLAQRLLTLTIHELFHWRLMQTDPNWSNFMYNGASDTIGLVDFGAARAYNASFVAQYFDLVWAAANGDEHGVLDASYKLQLLTGDESPAMTRAHVAAGMVVGEPFRSSTPFDFHASALTQRLQEHLHVFLTGRLTPPPPEIYSLHRKLAGAFLMCIKLRAVLACRDVLEATPQARKMLAK